MSTSDNDSIFWTYREIILDHKCLQDLTLHLFNNDEWRFNLADQLATMDAHCMGVAIGMMLAFHQRRADDPAFLELGKEVEDQRLELDKYLGADPGDELDEELLERMAEDMVAEMVRQNPMRQFDEEDRADFPRFDAPRRDPEPGR